MQQLVKVKPFIRLTEQCRSHTQVEGTVGSATCRPPLPTPNHDVRYTLRLGVSRARLRVVRRIRTHFGSECAEHYATRTPIPVKSSITN